MNQRKTDRNEAHIDWSAVADLRFISAPEAGKIQSIQNELDFNQASINDALLTRPNRFIVRGEKEIELLGAWEGGSGVLLRAPWRSGKTELVQSLVERLDLADRFVAVNALDTPYPELEYRPVEELRRTFGAREVTAHIEALHRRRGEGDAARETGAALARHLDAGGSPFSFLGAARKALGEPPALVALDEISCYGYNQEHLQFLASLVDEPHLRICLIVQKSPRIEDNYAQAFAKFGSVYLEPLRLGETAQLVRAKSNALNLSFATHALVEIHRATGGRPLEIGALVETCHMLAAAGKHPAAFTADSISRLVDGQLIHLQKTPLEPLLTNHIRVFEMGLSGAEQELVDALAAEPLGLSITAENRPAAERLAKFGIVAREGDRFFLNGTIFSAAVRERMTTYRTSNYWQRDEYGNDYPA